VTVEKDSYRHSWTYDLSGTSNDERSAFCEKSEVATTPCSRGLGRGPGGGPALPPAEAGRGAHPARSPSEHRRHARPQREKAAELLALLRSLRVVALAPAQLWAIALDDGCYLASISPMCRCGVDLHGRRDSHLLPAPAVAGCRRVSMPWLSVRR